MTQEATNDGMDRQSVEHGRLSRSSIPVEKRGLESNRSNGCTSRCMLLHSQRIHRPFLHPFVLLLTNESFPLGSCHTRPLVTNGRPCPPCRFLVVPHRIPPILALSCIPFPCLALHPIVLPCLASHCLALPCLASPCIALHCIALHLYFVVSSDQWMEGWKVRMETTNPRRR